MGIFEAPRQGIWRILAGRRSAGSTLLTNELWSWTIGEHRIFRGMGAVDESRLRELSSQFLAKKRFDPRGGAKIDDRLKVSIASQACLPLLGLDLSWYRDFSTIFLMPESYTVTQKWEDESGVVHEYEEELAGEAFDLGPVALSIPDVDASGWGDGYNAVIHEMAHKLDGLNGSYDGRPPLHRGMDPRMWRTIFTEAWEDLNARLEASARDRRPRRGVPRKGSVTKRSRIDPYAAESPEEFFAVACEYFWEKPAVLIREYPAVFEQLKLFFRRDPSLWGK
ncbi:MAG: M90 family metallopeptidase [Rectinemataceae bacterium]